MGSLSVPSVTLNRMQVTILQFCKSKLCLKWLLVLAHVSFCTDIRWAVLHVAVCSTQHLVLSCQLYTLVISGTVGCWQAN